MDFLKLLYARYLNYEEAEHPKQTLLSYTEFREKLSQLLTQAEESDTP